MARGRPVLLEGEHLAVVLRRAWYTLIAPTVVLLLCAGLGGYAAGRIPAGDAAGGGPQAALRWIVGGTAVAVALRWSVWPFLIWYSRSLRITTARVVLCDGVFARRGTEVPLGRITEVGSRRTGLRRVLGGGRLTISFAGGYAADLFPVPGAPGRGSVCLDDVPAVAVVHRYLEELVAATPRIAFLPPSPPGESERPFAS
ncbi:MAG: PH domain-containing protein [Sporichthyaceae bacterium]